MIPNVILAAALFTLMFIICINFYSRNTIAIKAQLFFAIFFWTLSLFNDNIKWYSCLIAALAGSVSFLIKETEEPKAVNNESNSTSFNEMPFVNKTGAVVYDMLENGQYMGVLDESKDSILVYSNDKLHNEDKFIITSIDDGKIWCKKID